VGCVKQGRCVRACVWGGGLRVVLALGGPRPKEAGRPGRCSRSARRRPRRGSGSGAPHPPPLLLLSPLSAGATMAA
jgi:hypothetical protein